MAPSLIVETIAGCRYACVLFSAMDLANEIFANGNNNCQKMLLWHLKSVSPSDVSHFFGTINGIIDTFSKYVKKQILQRDFAIQANAKSTGNGINSDASNAISYDDAIFLSENLVRRFGRLILL